MKTKLSFLALPFCLGLVLTFVIAACSSGDSPNGPSNSSNSNSGGGNSYSRPPDVDDAEVVFSSNFDVVVEGNLVVFTGNVDGSSKDHIVKLEFLTNGKAQGWVTYKDDPVTGPISMDISTVVLSKAEIDLTNSAIPCGTHSVTVGACIQSGKCSQKSKDFTKPESMCAVSSSDAAPSSSSEAVWVFGDPTYGDTGEKTTPPITVTISSGTIKLTGDAESFDTQPDMEVSGGTIRRIEGATGGIDVDEGVVPGKAYPARGLGSNVPTGNTEVLQFEEFYLLYLSSGSVYLVQFTSEGKWFEWPKSYKYWRANEHP